jgi:hypothetical protein
MSTLLDRIGQGFGTHWREAVEELWRRRLRTLLTLLGTDLRRRRDRRDAGASAKAARQRSPASWSRASACAT